MYALVVRTTVYERRQGQGALDVEREVVEVSLIWAHNWWAAWLIAETTKEIYAAWRARRGFASETSYELHPVFWMHSGRIGERWRYASRT